MKKYFLSIAVLLLLLIFGLIATAQAFVKTELTASLKAKLEAMPKAPALPKPSAADISRAHDYADAFMVFFAKAVLHKSNPSKFPMNTPPGSMEKRSLDFVNTFSSAQLKKATDRFNVIVVDPAEKAKAFGRYRNLDFYNASTTDQLKSMDDKLHFSQTTSSDATMVAPYTKIEFDLKGIYCLQKTTSPEDVDEIIIAGLLSGLHNEVFPANTCLAGNYTSGYYANGGFNFGTALLHPSESFPKTFYSYLLVIEYDGLDINQARSTLNSQMQSLANDLSGLEASEAFYHNYIAFSLANAGQIGFWDDGLNIKEVPVVLSNLNAFGTDKVSDDLNTGDIYGWGARYQIVYNWRLIK